MYADGSTVDGRRIIQIALETFDSFVSTSTSCRFFIKLDIIKQLVSNHMAQFNILQNDTNYKHLGQFFKVLTILWVHEEFIDHFDSYISQLNPIIEEILRLP